MSETRKERAEEQARRRVDAFRFGVYVVAILCSLSVVMLVPPVVSGRLGLQAVISLPLVAGLFVVSRSLKLLVVGIAIGVTSTTLGVLSIVRDEDVLLILDLVLRVGFLLLTGGWIAREVLRQKEISTDTILGGICVYLLFGLLFAFLDAMIVIAVPDAFQSTLSGVPIAGEGKHSMASLPSLLYFSFATLTTAAYGDITPVAPIARLVSIVEAMIGQLFPTIFIARLVGLHVAQRAPAHRSE